MVVEDHLETETEVILPEDVSETETETETEILLHNYSMFFNNFSGIPTEEAENGSLNRRQSDSRSSANMEQLPRD